VRQQIAAKAKEIEFRVDNVTIQLLRIPPGEFEIGSDPAEDGHRENEEPVRKVKITKPFYLAQTEITQAQYRAVTGENPAKVQGNTIAVDQLTYRMAFTYCEKLTERVGVKVTLPTEAQWEYACRAGTRTRYHSGDREEDLAKVGWFAHNSGGRPHPVRQKLPNAFGLYDMHGNVGELCSDFIGDYQHIDPSDPLGDVSEFNNAERGGSNALRSQFCRSASRAKNCDLTGDAGLRIAVNLETAD
jgi:formylglycine-generating enzyme required for sulfatase activity